MDQIQDVMSEHLVTVDPMTPVPDALARLRAEHVHHALVVHHGEMAGVVCSCDLEAAATDAAVCACFKPSYVFIEGEASSSEAAELMQRWGIGFLPVLGHDGQVVGVVTRRDLRARGLLPGERGVDLCAGCGKAHSLTPRVDESTPVFCRDCLEPNVLPSGFSYTIGGGD
jgi:CBS-domain-containing membrane protein